jgi:branched-chain amino acid transport system substrate-binding protein
MPRTALIAAGLVLALIAAPAQAQKNYGPGVSDSEIKLGNTAPYSGPVSAASTVAKSVAAYFDKINAEGGINGRKLSFISIDDGYAPPKTVEATRRLVESDQVLALVGSVGTPPQLAVRKYLNDRRVPQLFIGSGSSLFHDPQSSPWSLGSSPSYYAEGRLAAKHFAEILPGAKVAVLSQNDDFGKEFLRGFKEALPADLKIVAEETYETSDPTVDSQIVALKGSGATAFALFATQKAAAQAIRRANAIDWKPKIIMPGVIASIAAVLEPAGIEASIGVITATVSKDVNDPRLQQDPAVIEYLAWAKTYNTKVDVRDSQASTGGYIDAQLMVAILKACGDDLTRENVMRHASNLDNVKLPIFLDGITAVTTPTDYRLFRQIQFQSFNGKSWDRNGPIVGE